MNTGRLPIFAFVVLLSVGLAGCGASEDPADFTFLNREPETIDPGRTTGQPGGRIALSIFEGLTYRHHRTLAPQAGMAHSWDVSPDGRTYVFHLRPASWSDGTAVTSRDFRYTWRRLLDPDTGAKYAGLLYPLRGARDFNAGRTEPESLGMNCPDDSTFVVSLEAPTAYFLDLCAFYPLAPVPPHIVEAHGDDWVRPGKIVSNGAYLLESWHINRRVRLVRNPHYWNAASVSLQTVDAMHGDYINGNFNRYISGLFDWIDADGVPLAIIEELKQRPDFHVSPYLNTYFYRFNVKRPPFDNPGVRRAFYHAVDSKAIAEHVMRAGQIPAHSLVPPGLPGYTEVQLSGFDPELARKLLAEAGYPDGKGFPQPELLFNTSESHKQVAEVIQQNWKQVLGVEVTLRNQEWKTFQVTTQGGDYDIARGGWIGDYLDPNTYLDMWTAGNGNNRTGFASPEYDALIQQAALTVDPVQRMALLRRCEEIVTQQECIILPVYYYVVTNLYDATKWAGLEPNLINFLDLKSVRRRPGAS